MKLQFIIYIIVVVSSVICDDENTTQMTNIQKINTTMKTKVVKKHITDEFVPNQAFDLDWKHGKLFEGSAEIQKIDLEDVLEFLNNLVNEKIRQNFKFRNAVKQNAVAHFRGPISSSIENKHDVLCFHRQYGVKLNKLLPKKDPCLPKKIKFQVQSAKSPGKLSNTFQVDTSSYSKGRNMIPTTSATLQLFKDISAKNRSQNMKKKITKFVQFQ
jgi:hypothetical protein